MVQSTPPLGSYVPAGPMVLEVSVMANNALRAYGEHQWENHKAGPCDFWRKVMSSTAENYISLGKQFLASYSDRGKMLDYGTSNDPCVQKFPL